MRKVMVVIRRGVFVFFWGFLLFWKSCVSTEAKQFPPVYDFTTDFQAYAEVVSAYNQGTAPDMDNKDINGDELPQVSLSPDFSMYTVITRTNGVELQVIDEDLLFIVKGPEDHYMLYYKTEKAAKLAAERLRQVSGVIYAEVDSEIEMTEESEDELGGNKSGEFYHSDTGESISFNSWGAERMGFSSYLPYITSCQLSTATVAVIDSGVYPHDYICPKMPESGYDYVDTDTDATNDENGHGTHVAGIITDCTSSLPVYIYPIRVLNANGSGKMSNFITAISEARNKGVDVVNLSLSSKTASDAMDYEIRECVNEGITVVIAAGNNNADTIDIHPSNLMDPGIVVVGSVVENDGEIIKASYSNFGESVDVYAYGSNIVSCSTSNGLATRSGTSQAAPHISGICAMMRIIHPEIVPSVIENRIKAGSVANDNMLIPSLISMIPREEGFRLTQLTLSVGDSLLLPAMASPYTACEEITYSSSNEDVIVIDNTCISALRTGDAVISASCTGFDNLVFSISVEEEGKTLYLPEALMTIGDDSFDGITEADKIVIQDKMIAVGNNNFTESQSLVYIPDSVEEIGENSFRNSTFICSCDSYPARYAKENGLQYIYQCQ